MCNYLFQIILHLWLWKRGETCEKPADLKEWECEFDKEFSVLNSEHYFTPDEKYVYKYKDWVGAGNRMYDTPQLLDDSLH